MKKNKEEGIWVVHDLRANSLIQNLLTEKQFSFEFFPSMSVFNNLNKKEAFSDQDIGAMRKIIENKDIFDDDEIDKFKEERKKVSTDSVILSKLFLKCYDVLNINSYMFYDKEKNKYSERLDYYLQSLNETASLFRDKLEKLGDGSDFGSHYLTQNIISLVSQNRIILLELITLFFKLAGEEE